MEPYNDKIDYLICKFALRADTTASNEKDWRDVYAGAKEPEGEGQAFMMKAKRALTFLKACGGPVTKDEVSRVCELLGGDPQTVTAEFFEGLETCLGPDSGDVPFQAYRFVILAWPFGDLTPQMASMVFTMERFALGVIPVVFFPALSNSLDAKIKGGAPLQEALALAGELELRTSILNTHHRLITFDEASQAILSAEDELRSSYGIASLGIYGSFGRGEEDEYSDLDVFLYVSDEKKADPSNKYLAFAFLREKLGIRVDGRADDVDFDPTDMPTETKNDLKVVF
jgi:predicted nucleotidyltransferase